MQKYIDLKEKINFELLKEPAKMIKEGKIVIFPTETVYGIGTNGFDEEAIKKIYKIKKRNFDKPISLLVNNIEMIESVAKDITDLEYALINRFCPGPFTIILKKRKEVPNILTSNRETVGIRIPEGEIARKLIEYSGVPIATPSANISGRPSGTNIEYIKRDFEGKVDCIIDAGESKLGIASTIVKVENGKPIILREGSIKKEEIFEFINSLKK